LNLIARKKELGVLKQCLVASARGQLRVAFILGEAGVGKTVLMDTFSSQAAKVRSDVVIASSRCYHLAGSQQEPYLPFVQILQQLAAGDQSRGWDRIKRGLAELAPEWIQIVPVGGDFVAAVLRTIQWGYAEFRGSGKTLDFSRYLIQYSNALRLMAESFPLILKVDDLQWADNASLDLISFLVDHLVSSRILLIATARSQEIFLGKGEVHPVRRLIDQMVARDRAIELELSNFSQEDLRDFLAHTRHQLPGELVDRLYRLSGGNPFFIRETINLLHARRLFRRERGDFIFVSSDLDMEIPSTVRGIVQQRLNLLDEDSRRLLSCASAQGERFASRVLSLILSSEELALLEKLRLLEKVHKLILELERQQLVEKVGYEYQFVHALIQESLYKDLTLGQRQHLHHEIACNLENIYGEDVDFYCADLAFHYERGGDPAKAVEYHLRASARALGRLALEDAEVYLNAARRIIVTLAPSTQVKSWELKAYALEAQRCSLKGDYVNALVACEKGLLECSTLYNKERAQLLYWQSVILDWQGQHQLAVDPLSEALNLTPNIINDQRLLGMLYARYGSFYQRLPLPEVLSALKKALEISEQNHLPDVKVMALENLAAVTMNRTDNPEEAFSYASQALQISQEFNWLPDQVRTHRILAYASRHLKRRKDALFHNERAVEIARQSGVPDSLHMALNSLALTYRDTCGNWQSALECLHQAEQVALQYRFPISRGVLDVWFTTVLGLGDWIEAGRIADLFRQRIDTAYPRSWGFYYRQMGHLAYATRQVDKAVEAYQQALQAFSNGPSSRDNFRIQPYLGLALADAGELDKAAELLYPAAEYWENRRPGRFARSLRALARLSCQKGKILEALKYLERAESISRDLDNGGSWPHYPHIAIDLANVLLELEEAERAVPFGESAFSMLNEWGHFLTAEAAWVSGRALKAVEEHSAAKERFQIARKKYSQLGFTFPAEN
jgi:predicted ATPase